MQSANSAHVCTPKTTAGERFVPVKTFAQLKPGTAICSAKFPRLTGIFKFEGHGLAVIRLDAMNRDSLCQLKDIHAKLEAPTC